jgi:hypothetical protein
MNGDNPCFCFCLFKTHTMREQYEYQRAVEAELGRALTSHGKLTTFGVVLDVEGDVFWLNQNNYNFADELLRLLEQGAVVIAYLGASAGQKAYLNVLAGQENRQKALESFGHTWLHCAAGGPPLNFTLCWPEKLLVQ